MDSYQFCVWIVMNMLGRLEQEKGVQNSGS